MILHSEDAKPRLPEHILSKHILPLERKAAQTGALHFLAGKHRDQKTFELRDLPTSTAELTPELRQRLAIALDKILQLCESFPDGSTEVYILRHFAIALPQLFWCMAHVQNMCAGQQTCSRESSSRVKFKLWKETPGNLWKSPVSKSRLGESPVRFGMIR